MPRTYELPDGSTTDNEYKYDAGWMMLSSWIKEITGMRVVDFDPGVTLSTHDKKTTINLPVWFLKAFNEGLERYVYNIKYMNHCTCKIETWELHSCPFKEEINDDSETLCTCCPYCESQCKENI